MRGRSDRAEYIRMSNMPSLFMHLLTGGKNNMKNLEQRYHAAMETITPLGLLNLPSEVKEILKNTQDLETKVKMLELIVQQGA